MGVSGCGKSTVGRRLAKHFGLDFIEGDDYHPAENVAKMAAGNSLNDEDRQPWLEALAQVLAKASTDSGETQKGAVLACSALKKAYRDTLQKPLQEQLLIVWLEGSREVLLSRLQARKDHFFPPHLLDSQLETLEPPTGAIRINIDQSVKEIVAEAIAALSGD